MTPTCIACNLPQPAGTMGRCPHCQGILRPIYPETAVRQLHTIAPGPGIDRYRALLPVDRPLPYLGEGNTPLLPSRRLGPELGLTAVYFKNEGLNPSGAFKDRAGALVTGLAQEAGQAGVVTASSGNASSAISAYCAAVGLPCTVLLEPGNPPTKLRQTVAAGARVIAVDGLFSRGPEAVCDLILDVARQANDYPAFVWAPVNPYILEAIKTIAYEIVAQLQGAPDLVVCPVGGGDMLTAIWRGFQELVQAGIISRPPRMVATQSLQAPPLLRAFESRQRQVTTLVGSSSRVSGINVPFSGNHGLAVIYQSGGEVLGIQDDAIFATQQQLLRREGIWVEPAGATAVAALSQLQARCGLSGSERIVCILSGAGFKDAGLGQAASTAVGQTEATPFSAAAIVARMQSAPA